MTGWDITGCLSRICGKRVFKLKRMVWLDRRQSEFFRLFIL